MEQILAHFFANSSHIPIERIESGHINDTFLVQWATKKYILQRVNTDIFTNPKAISKNMVLINQYLKASDYRFQVVDLVKTVHGKTYFEDKKQGFWRVMPFIEESYAPEQPRDIAQVQAAGSAFGHFMASLKNLPVAKLQVILPNFHNATWRFEQFEAALQTALPARLKVAEKWVTTALSYQYLVVHYQKIIAELPLRTTHNDTKITNILFQKNTHQPLAIIDLDTVQAGTILSEFGDMVRTFCNTSTEDEANIHQIKFRADYFEALKTGFLSETASVLTPLEVESLRFGAQLTIYVQALRFLGDYLKGDVYYKVKYAAHNLVRAINQLVLLAEMNSELETRK
jgi:aminoglycoside phosphotransferase (APT) family kinase protein